MVLFLISPGLQIVILVYTLLAKVFGGGLTKKRRYDTEKNKEDGKNSHCGGVFGLTDDGVTYTLYNINGYALSDDREWCVTSMERIPEMGFPGVLLHKTAKGLTVPDGTQLYLVDQHGIAKPMPPKYVDATNFVDGLCAIATKVDGMVADWHFMDTDPLYKLTLRRFHTTKLLLLRSG